MAISFFTTSCANTTTVDSNENPIENTENQYGENESEENSIAEKVVDSSNDIEENTETVSVILTMFSLDNTESIENYVSKLKEENNSDSYTVYDETHYSLTMTEAERLEALEKYNSGELIEESFNEIFSDEQYNSAFTKMDYDNLFQNITFYADKEKYDSAGIAVTLGPIFIGSMYSDIIQAYNLIPIKERTCTIKILDNETNTVIYDFSSDE